MLNFGSGEESHILYKNISQVNFLGWNFWVYKSNEMKVSIEISKRLIFVKCYIKILTQGKLLDYTNISLNVTLISHIYMFLSWVGTVHFPHNWLFHLPSAIHNQRFLLPLPSTSFPFSFSIFVPNRRLLPFSFSFSYRCPFLFSFSFLLPPPQPNLNEPFSFFSSTLSFSLFAHPLRFVFSP